MIALLDFLRNNTAGIATAIRAVILCATAFGLNWTADQVAAAMLAVESILAAVVGKTTVSANKVQQRVEEAHAAGYRMGTGTGA